MKRGSTLFLKVVIVVLGLIVLAICVFAFPSMYKGMALEFPYVDTVNTLAFFGLYASAIPFYIALFQGFKLLTSIDRNTAFSEMSVKALRTIKYSAVAMTLCYFFCMPLVFVVAQYDDAPGAVLFGMAFACSPLVIAVFAAVLQKLLQNVIAIKSENELTV